MKKGLAFISITLILTACGSGSGKIKNITEFTTKLHSETTTSQVTLGAAEKAQVWNEGVNWINAQPENFASTSDIKSFSRVNAIKGSKASPIAADGKLFILSSNSLISALDRSTNKIIWIKHLNVTKAGSKHFGGGSLYYKNDKIFATYGTRDIVVLDASDGRELWRRVLPDVTRSQPILHNNILLVLTISNQLCALDADSGKMLWQNDGIPEELFYDKYTSPIIHGNKVIICYSSGELAVIDVYSGKEVIHVNLARDSNISQQGIFVSGITTQPIVSGNVIYVASSNDMLTSIDVTTGQIKWKRKLTDVQAMNASGNTLFVVTNARQVAAIDKATGLVMWVADLYESINSKGKITNIAPSRAVQFLTPVIVNNKLIIISSIGKMYMISPYTGAIDKIIPIANKVSSVIIDDNVTLFTHSGMYKNQKR